MSSTFGIDLGAAPEDAGSIAEKSLGASASNPTPKAPRVCAVPDKKRLLFIFNFLNLFMFFSEELRANAIDYLKCYHRY
jgi:hypothetical protein